MGATFAQISKRIHDAALKEGIPLSGDFELTPRCNLNCVMCYVRKSPGDIQVKKEELTALEWLDIARQARDAGMLYTLLTGGEIFIRKDIREIYEGMVQLGLIITLYTNGTLINEEIADWLAKAPPRKVSITLYGASPETYEKITGHRDGLERALKAVDLLRERNIVVELKTIMLEGNKADILPLFDYAFEREIYFGIVNYVFPTREDNDADPLGNRLDPVEAARLEKHVLDYIQEKVKVRNKHRNLNPTVLNPDEEDKLIEDDENSKFRCTAGKTSFEINWKGIMIPCGIMSDNSLGSAIECRDKEFLKAWEVLVRQVNAVPVNTTCKSCEYIDSCLTCPARVQIETGDFTGIPEYLCKNAEIRSELFK